MNIPTGGLVILFVMLLAAGGLAYFATRETGVVPSSCLGVMCRDPNDIRVERDGTCHCAKPVVCL